jgi:hypothetical protein
MTLGNMRGNGVRTLAVRCLGRGCNHHSTLDVSGYAALTSSGGNISRCDQACLILAFSHGPAKRLGS